MKRPLCRDMEGQQFELARDVESRGGTRIRKGEVVTVLRHWRGRFTIRTTDKREITREITKVQRNALKGAL